MNEIKETKITEPLFKAVRGRKVVVLNSGGFDSTVLLYHYLGLGYEVVSITFNYGQPAYELERARNNCKALNLFEDNIKEITINIDWALKDVDPDTTVGNVGYIPMRNAIFISMALSYAQCIGAEKVAIGVIGAGGFDDNNQDFVTDMDYVAQHGGLRVEAPLSNLDKFQVYSLGNAYGLYADDVWSCNTPIEGKRCGTCNDCVALKEGIRKGSVRLRKDIEFFS